MFFLANGLNKFNLLTCFPALSCGNSMLWHCGISLHCVTKWGVTPGLFGDHFVVSKGRCVCLCMCLWFYFSLHTGRFHVACLFWAFYPPSFFIVIHYLPSRFSTGLSVQFDRGWGRVFLVSGACGWVSSRVGPWVLYLGLGSGVPAPCS